MSMSDSKDDGSQSGWAPALMSCPHAQQHVKVLKDPIPDMESNQCSQCNNHTENWLCLHCQQLFCGRFASGHMLQHYQATGHAIAAGLGDLSFWCYSCDSYLNHLSIPNIYVAYARLHVSKFGSLPPQQPTPVTSKSRDVDGDEKKMSTSTCSTTSTSSSSSSSSSSTSTPFIPIEGLTSEQLNSPLVDKILGVIYGNALGDAYGLSTEFLDREDVKEAYDDAFPPFPGFKLNHHNARWDRGDWTDDTDQMILIMESLVETTGVTHVSDGGVPPVTCVFAKKLRQWIRNGFPELGDMGGMGLGMTVGAVCSHPNFVTNPREAATEMWNRSGKKLAANGAVMRTSILGCFQHTDLASVAYNTELFAATTHVDPRCIASCVAVTSAIAMILNGAPIATDADVARIMGCVTEITLPYVKDTPHKDEFLHYLNITNLSALELDASESIGYTLKCMGAGLYGLRSNDGFKTTMGRLVREAGDADTNGAVCGALLGAKLGYRGLPHDWIVHLPNKAWLDRKIIPFLQLVGAIEQ